MQSEDARLTLAVIQSAVDSIRTCADAVSRIVGNELGLEAAFSDPDTVALGVKSVPRWHFEMLNDSYRNGILERALKRCVTPETHMLDIGTGAGLLALVAARAGAAHVTTCEEHPLLAEIARKVININGFEDRITVVPKPSTQLVVGEDIERPADIVVSEIIDCGLVGEGLLPTSWDARSRLLADGGLMLPTAARLYGRLIESPQAAELNRVDHPSMFDIRMLNYVSTRGHYEIDFNVFPSRRLSSDIRLASFNFDDPDTQRDWSEVEVPIAHFGTVHALMAWFEVDFAGEVISNLPGPQRTHWNQACTLIEPPVTVRPRDTLRLILSWTHQSIVVEKVIRERNRT